MREHVPHYHDLAAFDNPGCYEQILQRKLRIARCLLRRFGHTDAQMRELGLWSWLDLITCQKVREIERRLRKRALREFYRKQDQKEEQ